MLRPRARKVKILATLGPASSSPEMIRALMDAGADAFRINMSHGSQAEKARLVESIRALEKTLHRPTTILFDRDGKEVWRFVGDLDWSGEEAAKLLAEANGGSKS